MDDSNVKMEGSEEVLQVAEASGYVIMTQSSN